VRFEKGAVALASLATFKLKLLLECDEFSDSASDALGVMNQNVSLRLRPLMFALRGESGDGTVGRKSR